MSIQRQTYLDRIKPFVNQPLIKILVGMRRVGKSTLLKQISEHLLSDVSESQKIMINLESFEYLNVRGKLHLSEIIQEKIKNIQEKIYFFFDEIQLADGWEEVINGLQVSYDCDIYITGSNAQLLKNILKPI